MEKYVSFYKIFGQHCDENIVRGRHPEALSKLLKISIDQAKGTIENNGLFGLAKLLADAHNGRADKSVKTIEKMTQGLQIKSFGKDFTFVPNGGYCVELFSENRVPYGYMNINPKGPTGGGRSLWDLIYTDMCLLGARIAELREDYRSAKRLYDRAKVVIDSKLNEGWPMTYIDEFTARNDFWKRSMKRMYKNRGSLETVNHLYSNRNCGGKQKWRITQLKTY